MTAGSVQIVVPSNWSALVPTELPKLQCEATTVRAALDWLTADYPQFGVRLFSHGRLASWVNIYLGEEDIRALDGLDTQIEAPTVLTVIQAVAGG
ncbi:MAG TPA: MoaD/ThiS family protein [Streptosporangiaceae bacterium]|jgi:molybdopterin synthase sulfur carrier subunit|nr:MoaD/ThiS family protein [Streptosporangiaceae bacterium]